jgi:hypothetical protein
MSVPIRYIAVPAIEKHKAARPSVIFSAESIGTGATVIVEGNSAGGWVFCGVLEFGSGDFLRVTGGTVGLIYGFSGDSGEVRFSVTHDGVSSEVVIEYSTRAD